VVDPRRSRWVQNVFNMKEEDCPCPKAECERHGLCDECKENHYSKGKVMLSDTMQEYTLSFSANDAPESVGHKIGIEFTNVSSGDTWIGLDNIRLNAANE